MEQIIRTCDHCTEVIDSDDPREWYRVEVTHPATGETTRRLHLHLSCLVAVLGPRRVSSESAP